MEAGLALLFNELPDVQPSAYEIPSDIPALCVSPVAPPNISFSFKIYLNRIKRNAKIENEKLHYENYLI